MSQSNDNLNEEWRKIFGEASEPPPPEIWGAIEKHLDEQTTAPLMTPWWKKPQAWLAAASVVLALGIGATLLFRNYTDPGSHTASTTESLKSASSPEDNRLPEPASPSAGVSRDHVAAAPRTGPEAEINGKGTEIKGKSTEVKEKGAPDTRQTASDTQLAANTPVSRESTGTTAAPHYSGNDSRGLATSPVLTGSSARQTAAAASARPADETRPGAPEIAMMEPLPFRELETHWQTRYVFFNPYADSPEEEPQHKPESAPLWAGLSLMPAGFNPSMRFSHQSVYQANNVISTSGIGARYDEALVSNNRSQTRDRDQPKISYQAAAQLGWNLSKNWSLESGIAYFQGNSTSRSPGFFMDRNTHRAADLLPNAMVSGNTNFSPETIDKLKLDDAAGSFSTVYVPRDKNMKNNYSFLQVPTYVGYTFRPEKKLSYTVLGGGVTNFFLKNELETASGYTLETKPENNVYHNVNLSAAAGLRVNYRLNQAWNTNLTANYQHALMTNFKSNQFLQSFPKIYGVSWGIRYTFQN